MEKPTGGFPALTVTSAKLQKQRTFYLETQFKAAHTAAFPIPPPQNINTSYNYISQICE